ncbi:MAG: DNA-binding protein [Prevotella sp.]|nr:DNA-binding protein [Prevotella sp.]
MIRFIPKQNQINTSKVYGRYFAMPVIEETLDLDGLADHMSHHNSPYSKGVIKGLLTDMVSCIKEMLLEGKNVKIDDLAIFSVGIKNAAGGAASVEEFSVAKNIEGVKLRARATGDLSSKALNLEATLRKATSLLGGTVDDSGDGGSGSGDSGADDGQP